jgi:hypothetical protein
VDPLEKLVGGLVVGVQPDVQKIYAQNYWVFGIFLSSGILETRKHKVSETGSVSVLR